MTDNTKYKRLRGLGVSHGYAVALAGGGDDAEEVGADVQALSDALASLTARVEALENPEI
jgi:hypothetical protein